MKRVTNIPAKPRNKKLIPAGGGDVMLGGIVNGGSTDAPPHLHYNKPILDLLTQKNIDVLSRLSIVNNSLQIEGSAYSTAELSAYGLGAGGGGSTAFDRLDAWSAYDTSKAGWVLSAALGFDLYTSKLNKSDVQSWALAATKPTYGIDEITGLRGELNSLAGANHTHAISAITGLQAALDGKAATSHNHNGIYEPVFIKNTAFNKNFGTSVGSVAEGNHVHAFASLTSKPTTLTGYGITDAASLSAFNAHNADNARHITTAERTNWNKSYSIRHSHGNKTIIDQITQGNLDVLSKLSLVNGNLQISVNAYSTGELSAYGLGSGSGGGGGSISVYDGLDSSATNLALSANMGRVLNSRLSAVEGGSATSVSVSGSGNAVTNLTKLGNQIIAEKGISFALANHAHSISAITGLQAALDSKAAVSHNHNGVYEPVFSKNTAFNKNFGTAAGTVAAGNHGHTFASLTSKPTTLSGYGITDAASLSAFNSHNSDNVRHITAAERANWNASFGLRHSHANKAIIDQLSQANLDVLSKLSIIDGNLQISVNAYSTGSLSAYGLGPGGSGGSISVYDALDSAATNLALSANMGRVLNSRLSAVEGGSATSVSVSGSGNAVTNLTKLGNQIIAEKGISFALANHAHSWDVITGKPSTFAPNAHTHLWTDITNRPINLSQFQNDSKFTDSLKIIPSVENVRDANAVLSGRMGNYYALAYWKNQPLGMSFGTIYGFGGHAADGGSLELQLAADVNHNTSNATKNLWFRMSNNLGFQNDWKQIYHAGNDGSGSGLDADLLDGQHNGNLTAYKIRRLGDNRDSFRPKQVEPASLVFTFSTHGALLRQANDADYCDVLAINSYTDRTAGWINALAFDKNTFRINHFAGNFGAENWVNYKTLAYITDNVASATKLQTPRTIAGVPFDGTYNIAIQFASLSSKPTTLSGYGITDAASLSAFNSHNSNKANPHSVTKAQIGLSSVDNTADRLKNVLSATRLFTARNIFGQSFDGMGNVSGAMSNITTISASVKTACPIFDFTNGWTFEAQGAELVAKLNGVVKGRFTATGFISTAEVAAYS